jgi:DNA-binding transcriptional regulator of glucitol operon
MITIQDRARAAREQLAQTEEQIRQYQQALNELTQRALILRGRAEAYSELAAEEESVKRETEDRQISNKEVRTIDDTYVGGAVLP